MTTAHTLLQAALQVLEAHPKRVMGTIGAILLTGGVTATAIAPLAPDAANLPVRQVLESVELEAPQSLAALPTLPGQVPGMVLYRHDFTRGNDTMVSLLQRLGVADVGAAEFLKQSSMMRELLSGKAGKLVQVQTDGQKRLLNLTARWSATEDRTYRKLVVERTGNQFLVKPGFGELKPSIRTVSGTIQTSLFAATDALGMPEGVATQMAEIFSSDIDFRRDLRKGDRFSVVYESLEADGEPLRAGRILSAEFINAGKPLQSVWFQEPGSKGGYYGFDGQSKRRTYLASPLAFSRVSSGYGMRFHPVAGHMAAHTGIDLAAPTGTPVMVVGDGTVRFAGWQRGYGNYIVVDHRNREATAYAHLSRIMVRVGERVTQGSTIGLVGSTGVSTGAHLHFEFLDNGVFKDPLIVAKRGETIPIAAASRPAFEAQAKRMKMELAAASGTQVASAN